MVYLKCLDIKKSKIFFIKSNLDESNQITLVDILLDLKIKISACSLEQIENQNPFIQDEFDILEFENNTFNPELALQFLNNESKLEGRIITTPYHH